MSQSLQSLLLTYPVVLVIDSASTTTQVGLLRRAEEANWEKSSQEAGVAIFTATEAALNRSKVKLSDVAAFIFCDGPGSVLGIRTAAVALRTWRIITPRPVFAYGSLDLVAKFQLRQGAAAPFSIIADARRDTWHSVSVNTAGDLSSLARLKANELVTPLLMPDGFRHWAPLPGPVHAVSYDVPAMFAAMSGVPLFRETSEPDAFLHEEPVYQTWTPQVHRAPS